MKGAFCADCNIFHKGLFKVKALLIFPLSLYSILQISFNSNNWQFVNVSLDLEYNAAYKWIWIWLWLWVFFVWMNNFLVVVFFLFYFFVLLAHVCKCSEKIMWVTSCFTRISVHNYFPFICVKKWKKKF